MLFNKLYLRSGLTIIKMKTTSFQVPTLLKREDCQLAANKLNNKYYLIDKMGEQ